MISRFFNTLLHFIQIKSVVLIDLLPSITTANGHRKMVHNNTEQWIHELVRLKFPIQTYSQSICSFPSTIRCQKPTIVETVPHRAQQSGIKSISESVIAHQSQEEFFQNIRQNCLKMKPIFLFISQNQLNQVSNLDWFAVIDLLHKKQSIQASRYHKALFIPLLVIV